MDSTFIIEKSVVIVVVFAITMVMAMYSTWAERKVAAFLQDRVGPNRAGWGGLFQPLADGLKLFSKEEFAPNTPNKFLFFVGPAIAMSNCFDDQCRYSLGRSIASFWKRYFTSSH